MMLTHSYTDPSGVVVIVAGNTKDPKQYLGEKDHIHILSQSGPKIPALQNV